MRQFTFVLPGLPSVSSAASLPPPSVVFFFFGEAEIFTVIPFVPLLPGDRGHGDKYLPVWFGNDCHASVVL